MRGLLLSSAFMALLVIVLSIGVEAQSEEFVPYIPDPSQVGLIYWEHSGIPYMNITLEFPDTGFNISSWGTPVATMDNVFVDAEIWRYTGLSFPVVTAVSHTYTLGALPCGEYNFLFKVWGFSVRNATFVVSLEIIVPDDYSSIQDAINAASDGGTVFVRNGTYSENVIVNKTVSLIGQDNRRAIIDGRGAGHVVKITADNVTLTGFTAVNSMWYPPYSGIHLDNVQGSKVRGNRILNSYRGLWLRNSCRNIVQDNVISDISESLAFWLDESHDNLILSNAILNCSSGIYISHSNNNRIQNNHVSNHTYYGVTLAYSNGTTINSNVFSSKAEWNGISLYFSNNSTITRNYVSQNTRGLKLTDAHRNVVYHNNFIDNTNQLVVENSFNNTWDNGCEGNYWSNYNGTDLDGDGIGDLSLPWVGVDHYPLMNPYWNPADVNHDLKVDIYDAVLVCGAYNATPSAPNWNPHCDLVEPYGLVDIYDAIIICDSYGEEYAP